MAEITNLMRKLAASLFESESEQEEFLDALLHPVYEKNSAVIWTRPESRESSDLAPNFFCPETQPDWLPAEQITFLKPGSQAGKSTSFQNGDLYPLDISSVYTASAMLKCQGSAGRVLDVCAAPGGKTLFASSCLRPEFLLSNEVIGKRLGILRHNLKKTGRPNLFTQKLEAYQLAELAPGYFNLAIVDAPCSGQSLLAKGIENPGCFHPNIVKGNARRQLRILSQSANCVVDGGYLFYSTCTFAKKENETVIEKFLSKNPEFQSVEIEHLEAFQSPLSEPYGYRIYPHQKIGSGGFVCLMKKAGSNQGGKSDFPSDLTQYPV